MSKLQNSLLAKQSQHLALTPQVQQSIRFLTLSSTELAQEINQLLEMNPLLELEDKTQSNDDDMSLDELEPLNLERGELDRNHHLADSSGGKPNLNKFDIDNNLVSNITLREHLQKQIVSIQISQEDWELTGFLIDNLDADGYLRESFASLSSEKTANRGWSTKDFERCLKHVQRMDPPGIGGRSLQESLTIQIDQLNKKDHCSIVATQLVTNHLEHLATCNLDKLEALTKYERSILRRAIKLISSLKPHPASDFSNQDNNFIEPDVVIKRTGDLWKAVPVKNLMPEIVINKEYESIIRKQQKNQKDAFQQILREAHGTLVSLTQRNSTILKVAQTIVNYQSDFMENGANYVRPLTLSTVAGELGLHESTISRATNQKYMSTPHGLFEFKYFFNNQVTNNKEVSSLAIKTTIRKIIQSERSSQPLSDNEVKQILSAEGFAIARRTVAKYRESMKILPANLRKNILHED
jgi:RNA polymerase sigma-54 factor